GASLVAASLPPPSSDASGLGAASLSTLPEQAAIYTPAISHFELRIDCSSNHARSGRSTNMATHGHATFLLTSAAVVLSSPASEYALTVKYQVPASSAVT